MMNFKIRPAQKKDLPCLFSLYEALNKIPAPLLNSGAEAVFDEILHTPSVHLLVGESDGKAVATVTVTIIPSLTHRLRPYAVIEHLCVDEAYRNRGFASMLLAKCQETAMEKNCYKAMLITSQSNPIVHRLYRNFGFKYSDYTAYSKEF